VREALRERTRGTLTLAPAPRAGVNTDEIDKRGFLDVKGIGSEFGKSSKYLRRIALNNFVD
jgi:hypothetical protein